MHHCHSTDLLQTRLKMYGLQRSVLEGEESLLFCLWSDKGTLHRDSSCLPCKHHSEGTEDVLLQLQLASMQVRVSRSPGTRSVAEQVSSNSTLQ